MAVLHSLPVQLMLSEQLCYCSQADSACFEVLSVNFEVFQRCMLCEQWAVSFMMYEPFGGVQG